MHSHTILKNNSCQPLLRSSQTLHSSHLSHVITTTTSADEHWHLHRSEYRNTLIYAHMTSPTLAPCDISLGSLILPAPQAGDFV